MLIQINMSMLNLPEKPRKYSHESRLFMLRVKYWWLKEMYSLGTITKRFYEYELGLVLAEKVKLKILVGE